MIAGDSMEHFSIHETFKGENLHPALEWLNPPSSWRMDAVRSRLVVEPGGETDFWQRTHYGFRADNGHFLYAEIEGDGEISARVLATPAHQYDQAGLMVRSSEDCWLKTSVEYEPDGASQLGVVVTNHGYSDWSMQDFLGQNVTDAGALSYSLRVRWEGEDFLVEYAAAENGPWRPMRVAHLFRKSGVPWRCGLYACSPKGAGFRAEFSDFRIEPAE